MISSIVALVLGSVLLATGVWMGIHLFKDHWQWSLSFLEDCFVFYGFLWSIVLGTICVVVGIISLL